MSEVTPHLADFVDEGRRHEDDVVRRLANIVADRQVHRDVLTKRNS